MYLYWLMDKVREGLDGVKQQREDPSALEKPYCRYCVNYCYEISWCLYHDCFISI